ncbi:TniQ protein [Curtobacterium sp. PhB115]|nr:TniQ protein [Curtobacterium sp. PhB115]
MVSPDTGTYGSLPIRLHPQDDEWLPSAINRWAWYTFDSPPADLYAALGLADLHPNEIRALSNNIRPVDVDALSRATGLSPVRLRGMTLSRYDGRALNLRRTANKLQTIGNNFTWARRTGTRFCTRCLAEQPGVFPMSWRFNWTFVCLHHRQLLADVCPGCGNELAEPYGLRTQPRDPNRCSHRIRNADEDFYCDTPLDRPDHHDPLPTSSPVLRAQHFINDILRRAVRPSIELRDFASTMGSVRFAAPTAVIAQLAGLDPERLLGLIEPERRSGASPPADALSFAALAAAALRLRNDPEQEVGPVLREITLSRPSGYSPHTTEISSADVKKLLGAWGRLRAPMTDRVVRSLDHDLVRSHVSARAAPSRQSKSTQLRGAHVRKTECGSQPYRRDSGPRGPPLCTSTAVLTSKRSPTLSPLHSTRTDAHQSSARTLSVLDTSARRLSLLLRRFAHSCSSAAHLSTTNVDASCLGNASCQILTGAGWANRSTSIQDPRNKRILPAATCTCGSRATARRDFPLSSDGSTRTTTLRTRHFSCISRLSFKARWMGTLGTFSARRSARCFGSTLIRPPDSSQNHSCGRRNAQCWQELAPSRGNSTISTRPKCTPCSPRGTRRCRGSLRNCIAPSRTSSSPSMLGRYPPGKPCSCGSASGADDMAKRNWTTGVIRPYRPAGHSCVTGFD